MIGVDEVDRGTRFHSLQRRGRGADAQLIPAHVRHLEPRHVGKTHHFAGKDIETGVKTIFVAAREKELQAQANAEERLARAEVVLDRAGQTGFVQSGDGVAEGADAGQHDFVGLRDLFGIAADDRPAWPIFSNAFCTLRKLAMP